MNYKNEYESNMVKIIDESKYNTNNIPIAKWALWVVYSNLNHEQQKSLSGQFNIILNNLTE